MSAIIRVTFPEGHPIVLGNEIVTTWVLDQPVTSRLVNRVEVSETTTHLVFRYRAGGGVDDYDIEIPKTACNIYRRPAAVWKKPVVKDAR